MSTPDDLSVVSKKPFSDALEKFEQLLNQSGRAFLIGAGCSKCAGLPLTTELTEKVIASSELDPSSKAILTALRDQFNGAPNAHIEDYLSELIDLLAIADRRKLRGAAQHQTSIGGKSYDATQLRTAADQIKRAIAAIIEKRVSIETHRAFVAAIHRPIRVGKTALAEAIDYLVLNYDNALEDALALEKVPFADGMDGGATGWWNPQTFDRDGLAARVLKLHGSINWCELGDDPLPRRIASSLDVAGDNSRRILIWPASTKYREAQLDPYAQLMERARRAMRQSSGSQRVLVVLGYSFGDAHINLEMDRALRDSAGNLTIVAFTSESVPVGQLKNWIENDDVSEQVLVFAKNGFFHAKDANRSETDLPWWKFENVTRLIRGER
jgi:hypothetical protein